MVSKWGAGCWITGGKLACQTNQYGSNAHTWFPPPAEHNTCFPVLGSFEFNNHYFPSGSSIWKNNLYHLPSESYLLTKFSTSPLSDSCFPDILPKRRITSKKLKKWSAFGQLVWASVAIQPRREWQMWRKCVQLLPLLFELVCSVIR